MVLRIKFVLLVVIRPSRLFWLAPVILLLLLKWKSRNITKGPSENQLVFFPWSPDVYPDSRENKTDCFPRDLSIMFNGPL